MGGVVLEALVSVYLHYFVIILTERRQEHPVPSPEVATPRCDVSQLVTCHVSRVTAEQFLAAVQVSNVASNSSGRDCALICHKPPPIFT